MKDLPPECDLRYVVGIAVPVFAVSYVVPTDRFEIERTSTIITGRA
jgi:hypothetical protein